jgi:hypothetical protein
MPAGTAPLGLLLGQVAASVRHRHRSQRRADGPGLGHRRRPPQRTRAPRRLARCSEELNLTATIVREIDIVTTVAHVCDTRYSGGARLLAESNVATITARATDTTRGARRRGLRPLAERRTSGKVTRNAVEPAA